jgi:hypothetical protein
MADDLPIIDAPPPAGPTEAPPTTPPPLLVDEPVIIAPRARGRPRKKPADPAAGPSAPPPPFVGGPPRDAADPASASQAAAMRTLMADPEKAGKMLVGVVDGLLMMLANSRYGHMVEPNSGKPLVEVMRVSSKEQDELVAAVVMFMKASSMSISPGANMALAFGATYGFRAMALEAQRSALKKQTAA